METHFPYAPFILERQMFDFTPAEQKLVREAAQASYTQAALLVTAIKERKKKGGDLHS